jgi:hypothetical protein
VSCPNPKFEKSQFGISFKARAGSVKDGENGVSNFKILIYLKINIFNLLLTKIFLKFNLKLSANRDRFY